MRPGAAILNSIVDVPEPRVRIPRDKYIVEYDNASEDDVYDALSAPPIEDFRDRYTLDEIRATARLRDRMRRVDLDDINFEFGSWDVDPSEYHKLERIARAMMRVVRRNPNEVFLIEGYTDAVGSNEDNLSLSDRRAESVAEVLSEQFQVPFENLTTQGYGEDYLKVPTDAAERLNRRVAVRRITPLLARGDGPPPPSAIGVATVATVVTMTEGMVRTTPTAHRMTRGLAIKATAAVMNTGLTAAPTRTDVLPSKTIQRRVYSRRAFFVGSAASKCELLAPLLALPLVLYFCNDRNY